MEQLKIKLCLYYVFEGVCQYFQSDLWTTSDLWKEIKEWYSHPTLGESAKNIINILSVSRASSTIKQHENYFKKFALWCKKHNLEFLPGKIVTIAMFLSYLDEQCISNSVLNSYVYAIKWFHRLAGLDDPCAVEFVKEVIEGIRRKHAKAKNKKEPLTIEELKRIYDTFGTSNSLSDLRVCSLCFLGFAGFFRIQELLVLKIENLIFHDEYLEIKVNKSKTDIYREGNRVIISRTGKNTCPVGILQKYLKVGNITEDQNSFLFRPIIYSKIENVHSFSRNNVNISYTRSREIILDAFSKIGLEKEKFGTHSLRSGGASMAAKNGVSDRLFKAHGRWRSDNAKDSYVLDSLRNKMSVTKQLGI